MNVHLRHYLSLSCAPIISLPPLRFWFAVFGSLRLILRGRIWHGMERKLVVLRGNESPFAAIVVDDMAVS